MEITQAEINEVLAGRKKQLDQLDTLHAEYKTHREAWKRHSDYSLVYVLFMIILASVAILPTPTISRTILVGIMTVFLGVILLRVRPTRQLKSTAVSFGSNYIEACQHVDTETPHDSFCDLFDIEPGGNVLVSHKELDRFWLKRLTEERCETHQVMHDAYEKVLRIKKNRARLNSLREPTKTKLQNLATQPNAIASL